ncbi:lipoate--protein ligase family protein [Shouchella patagoniensis]|uniref:lipoate--protein ligase family protein n=1 Tax=Shouchella patagoniensis TaxID=228576 RepID=UPI0009956C01|nr:lipoate--protein ligase family protein [Shouchella patagoniensis]
MNSPVTSLPQPWRLIDNSKDYIDQSAFKSFAFDDMLCTLSGKKNVSSLRFWVHNQTVVLGTQDTRLAHIQDAIAFLEKQNNRVIVRNSGGLAVYLDEGVLNISLIFPGKADFSIDDGYEQMVTLIRTMFPGLLIETGEIIGSYCPGSYDLSINGRKFAGISQRRIRGGIAVQIYLCVSGSGPTRAGYIKKMYDLAVADSTPNFDYPHIQPEVMASINELTGCQYTVHDVVELAKKASHELGMNLEDTQLSPEEELLFESQLERVIDRHNRCLRS